MDRTSSIFEEWFRRKTAAKPIPIAGIFRVGYEYNSCVGPRSIYGRVVLSIARSQSFAFASKVEWPAGLGNQEELVLDGILDALFGRQRELLVARFELEEIGYHPVNSAPIGYYWAARRIVESVLAQPYQRRGE
jgi:hypothetical protein